MNRFEELQAFIAVVDFHGFSNAADKLGVAKSMVSRRVSELEARLGVQLLKRTTRRQTLTDSGQAFYRRAVQVLADLDEAEQIVSDEQCRLSGRIRLALPLGFGVSQLAAPIGDFLDANPKISIDVDLNDRQVDLVEENIDLAIRVGDLDDSSLVARRLASVRFVTCASPAYLEKNGLPRQPGELAEHEVLRYSNVAASRQWCFRQGNKTVTARVRHRLSANNGEFLAIVATRGVGIVSGPLSLLQAQIDSGELLPILDEFTREEAGMYAVYPPGRLISRRVKIFSDALRDYFRGRSI